MKRSVWLYGLLLGLLVLGLKWLEYQWLVRNLTWEVSLSLVAVLYMGLGYWPTIDTPAI